MKKNFIVCFLLFTLITFKSFAMPTPQITADGAILIEPSTQTVLYDKNGDTRFYPASTTKILTCLLLLEAVSPSDILTKTANSLKNVPSDSSHIGLGVGDQYSYLDGVHAILLESDNFVAYDMAVNDAGSIEAFAQKMNDRAARLGATSSHFVNPHGYHTSSHYTTPHDLALIAKAAFSNPTLVKIAGTPNYNFTVLNTAQKLALTHTSELLHKTSDYYNPHVIASKTGFHTPAGRVLVAKAHYNGIDLIGVVMKTEAPNQFADMNTLFSFGSENFKLVHSPEGKPIIANVSFSPWAKIYVDYAKTHGWIENNIKSFNDPLSQREFVALLSKALPKKHTELLSSSISAEPSSLYLESLPITKGQASSVLYHLSMQLRLTQHTLYKETTMSNLNSLPNDLQKAIRFTTAKGLWGTPSGTFEADTKLTYEEAIIIAYRLNKLYDSTAPYIFLEENFSSN